MRSGTRSILIASIAIALGVALGQPIVGYRSCEVALGEYTKDQEDWAALLAHRKTLQQVSDNALLRAHGDNGFREGRWNPPRCIFGGGLSNSVLICVEVFIAAFLGLHVAWLTGRAFNKLMDKLQ